MCMTLKVLCLVLVASLVSSCASTSLKESWRNPTLQGRHIHKVAVVSFARKDPNRRVYEEVIASELNKRGVAAVTGFRAVPDEEKMEWPRLEEALRQAATDTVLTVQTVKVEQQTMIQPGYTGTYPGYWYPPAFPSWSLYGYYGASMYYEPSYVSTYDIATIQVNLFDAQTGKLIWAGSIESTDPQKITELSKDLAHLVVDALRKEGLI